MLTDLKTIEYKLDKFTKRYNNSVNLKQNDIRKFKIAFYENGEELNIGNFNIEVRWVKPDNTIVDKLDIDKTIIKKDNTIEFALDKECTKVAGIAKMEVCLMKNGLIDSSWTIEIPIKASIVTGNQEVSKNTSNLLDKLNSANTTANNTYIKCDNWSKSHADVDTLITDVNDIKNWQIGGRNLALGTSNEYNSGYTNFSGIANTCIDLGNVKTEGLNIGDTIACFIEIAYENIVPADGKTAKISVQGPGNVTEWNQGVFPTSPAANISGSNTIQFKWVSSQLDANTLKNAYWLTQLRTDYIQSGKIKWRLYKVERGNKYTAWTPALEDLDARLVNQKEMHGMIAHRGLCDIYPENTLFAFQQCINNHPGLFGVETDVWQSKDGEFFIMHDETVDRTTNGTGTVNNLTSTYIKSLKIDAGTNLNGMDLKVPTLDKVLQLFQNSNLYICLELKPQSSFNYDKFCNMIQAYGMENKVIIISFDINMLLQVRKRLPYIYIMGNLDLTQSNIDTYGYLYNFIYSFPVSQFNQDLVNKVLNNKQIPLPWLVNDCGTLMNMKKGRCKLFTSNCIDRG